MQAQRTKAELALTSISAALERIVNQPGNTVAIWPDVQKGRVELEQALKLDRQDDLLRVLAELLDADIRSIEEMKSSDTFEQGIITKAELVDGSWSIGWRADDGGDMGCGIPVKAGVTVQVGADIRFYGKGFGYPFHGVDVDGVEVFYRTPWERLSERVRWLADYDRKKRERAVAAGPELDADFDGLGEALKARITRFREDPQFRRDGEGYEMFACVQAEVFAKRAREAAAANEGEHEIETWFNDGSFEKELPKWAELPEEDFTPALRWLLWWSKLPWDRQKELCPGMDDGHSGNTFGGAVMLATRLIRGLVA